MEMEKTMGVVQKVVKFYSYATKKGYKLSLHGGSKLVSS
jgi:hypothetical protein